MWVDRTLLITTMQKTKLLGILSIGALIGISALIYSQNALASHDVPSGGNAPFKPHHTNPDGTHVTGSPDSCAAGHSISPTPNSHGGSRHLFYQDVDNDKVHDHDGSEQTMCRPPQRAL